MQVSSEVAMRNADTAKRVGMEMLGGCALHGFDPDYRYLPPKWEGGNRTTFQLPFFVVGMMAEMRGMPWYWPENKHPMALVNTYLKDHGVERVEHAKEMLRGIRDKAKEQGVSMFFEELLDEEPS